MPNGEKFDCIVGNPPYQSGNASKNGNTQGGLWYTFLKDVAYNIVKDDGVIAFITPFIGGIGDYKKKNFKFDWFKKANLKYVNFDATKYFKVNSTICYYILDKKYKSDTEITTAKNDNFNINIKDLDVLPFIVTEFNIKILNKIIKKNQNQNNFNFREGPSKNINKPKIAIFSSRYQKWKNLFIDEDGKTDNKYKVSLELQDDEIDGATEYLKLKLPQFYFKIIGGEMGLSPTGILKNLPFVDFTRSWTDAEIYDHFKLTKAEIKYIEKDEK